MSRSAALPVREVGVDDLPRVRPWLAPDMAQTLPGDDTECWLLATDGDDRPQACLRLRRAIGLQQARHWYHVGCVVHAAPELGLMHRQHTLQLGNDLTGASEIADVAWDRGALDLAASARVLKRLLDAALQRLAQAREDHAPRLIVELPGLRDADGRSPFWDGLGRHFYAGDPEAAAQRFGSAWRSQVAALLPRQPVYTAFLSPAAQAAMAQVDPAARVLMDLLWQAGLRYGHHLRIDDGGPVFEGPTDLVVGPGAAR